MERKVYFALDACNWGWGGYWTPVQRPTSPLAGHPPHTQMYTQWAGAVIDPGMGLHAETVHQVCWPS